MTTIITVLILLACAVLAFVILVQNPKGGGLSGAFGSIGSQVMGVKQSTDVMEKGTWLSMGLIAVLFIVCVKFYDLPRDRQQVRQPQQNSAPAQPAAPAPTAPSAQ